jgi:hypothetical protein
MVCLIALQLKHQHNIARHVAALKLSKQELAEHILPEVRGVEKNQEAVFDAYNLKHQHRTVAADVEHYPCTCSDRNTCFQLQQL